MYLATVDCLTEIPNFRSSPWIRGAPQSGFAPDISRINARTSAGTPGRPVRCRLFQVQNRRKPRRCQARTVAGCTTWSAARHPCQRRDSQAHSTRSTAVNRSRERRERFTTASWCRSAMISRCRDARARTRKQNERSSETMTDATRRSYRKNFRNLNAHNCTVFSTGTGGGPSTITSRGSPS